MPRGLEPSHGHEGAGAPGDAMFEGYPDLLTPADVAEITGFSVGYVRRLCRERLLPGRRAGSRQWFIPKPLLIDHLMGE